MAPNAQTTSIGDTTYQKIAEVIKRMEVDLGLLRDEPYGRSARLAWEASRFGIATELKQRLCDHGTAHSPSDDYTRMDLPRLVRFCVTIGYHAVRRCPVFAPRYRKYLVMPHPRRKRADDGVYEEPYTDSFIGFLGRREYVVLERPYNWRHFVPRRQPEPWYAESVMLLAKALPILAPKTRQFRNVAKMAKHVEAYLYDSLGIEIEIRERVRQKSVTVAAFRSAYRFLLLWLRPKTVFLVVSYVNEPLILGARDLGIPTVEIQHGVISPFHFGYAVPEGERKHSSPDYLLTFGNYWKQTLDYSVDSDCIIPVGFPYFERERVKFRDVQKSNQIVFLSQGNIGSRLSQFAVDVARVLPDGIRASYKLHPGEHGRWRTEYPWLSSAAEDGVLTIVETDDPPLYKLLAESKWQMGVNSTALFEGLGLGCRTLLVDLPGVEYMTSLIQNQAAELISEPAEVLEHLKHDTSNRTLESTEFFRPDWVDGFRQALARIDQQTASDRVT